MSETTPASEPGIRWFALVLLVGHLALLGVGAWSLWDIAGGWWAGAVAAAVLVLLQGGLWVVWLAPGSSHRLGYKERLTVNLLLGTTLVVLAGLAGLWLPALMAASIVILCDALDQQRRP